MTSFSNVQDQVKEKYGNAARSVAQSGGVQACCDPGLRCCDPITSGLYSSDEKGMIPEKAVLASLGCGNPTALIDLRREKQFSISALAAALTFCSRRSELAPRAKHTAST